MALGQQPIQVNSVQQPSCGANPDTDIPRCGNYLKGIVASNRRLTKYETMELIEECNSTIQNKLPIKLEDLKSFTVRINIGKRIHDRGMSGLGTSIKLMQTSLSKKVGLGSPKPTTIILQLADRAVARSEGVVEDVLVQVGSLIFPVDFVVLNFEPDPEVPFILRNLSSKLEGQ
ncbi:uncharacterized protein LOC107016541 [Solanum pennellii]|uniref:Uncharacterized protein LOC107016541 n=1 Tax=Solanum pennellii TaxID=28526 RepID=A0ABM1GKS7_SOLPN|nr:uncharacterized protein LOC107016541 [Solanum pennellii]